MAFFTVDQQESLYKLYGKDEDYAENMQFLQGSLDEFLEKKVAPHAYSNDEQEIFPADTFKDLGKLGVIGMSFPEKYEGMELPFPYYCAALESLTKADAGLALGVAIHDTVTDGIIYFAKDEVKARHAADLVTGRKIAAFGLSEADSGSDAQNMKTSFRYDAARQEYILNGSKYWITNGLSADVFFIMARGDDGKVSAFVIDKQGEGTFTQHKIADKMGVRSSNTAELVFEDYRVPADALVGEIGKGFHYAMRMLNGGRITIACWSTGIAQGAYEKLLKYAHERSLFGKLLADLDNIKKEFATMLMEISAGRELYMHAAFYKENPKVIQYAALAKVKATEVAVYVGERVIELAGGYGYVRDSCLERPLRDALLGRIGEGANELLQIVVIPRIIYREFNKKPLTMIW